MSAWKLTVYAYQDLIDQGWRRSGTYLYKPDLARSCCKAYTIRLDVQQFNPDKAQRRLLRKWRSFLQGQDPMDCARAGGGSAGDSARTAWPPGVSASDLPTAATGPADAHEPRPHHHAQGQQRSSQPPTSPAATFAPGPPAPSAAGEPASEALQQLLAAALAAAVAAGDLPPAAPGAGPYPPPDVRPCTGKQRQALPADVRFTSAAAFQLAAAMSRRATPATVSGSTTGGAAPAGSQPQQPKLPKALRKTAPPREGSLSASAVAQVLARHFNGLATSCGAAGDGSAAAAPGAAAGTRDGERVPLSCAAPGVSVAGAAAAWDRRLGPKPEAYAANGHLNFRLPLPSSQPGAQGEAGGGGADEQGSSGGGGRSAAAAGGGRAPSCRSRTGSSGGDPPARAGQPVQVAASARSREPAAAPVAAAGAGAVAAGSPSPDLGPDLHSDLLSLPPGRLEIRTVPSQFVEEEFELYKRYQVAQHGDEPWKLNRRSYTRFLVESPLRHVSQDKDPAAPACGYGSFHQQYWLDGKLIAVGVVDVLPRCLSSVYLFWDPSLASLALGRFTALQEIHLVQRHVASCPALHYYYMGFYIHTCPKMRYKAEYRPSDLLCPQRKVWVRITPQLLAAIERRGFLELSAEQGALCQPNLAAPPRSAAEAAATGAAAEGAAAGGRTGGSSGQQADAGGSMDDTLVLLPEQGAAAGPVPLQVVRRCNLFSQRGLLVLEQAIREWRAAVGWTASSLVYEL